MSATSLDREREITPRSAGAAPEPSHATQRARLLLVGLLLAGGFLIRLPGIANPSIETRELADALLAREYHLRGNHDIPEWKQRVVRELGNVVQEPPVLEYLTGSVFRLVGREPLWIPRLASIAFWVLGGMFLYLIALRVTRFEGAFIALALYLFWPYPAFISRLFQPDAMMLGLLLGAALCIIRYWERPTNGRLWAAAGLSGAATVAKPAIAFIYLLALFVALGVSERKLVQAVVRGRLPLFIAIAILPSFVYDVYGVYVRGFFPGQGEGWIDPTKLWTAWFWNGWADTLSYMLVFPQHQTATAVVPLGVAVIGIAVSRGRARAILLGLAIAYVLFGLTVTVPIATHPYYSLPLIPTLSISIGTVAVVVADAFKRHAAGAQAAVFVPVALAVAIGAYKTHAVLNAAPPLRQIADYQRIGEITNHTPHAIVVDMRFRSPISYWGWMSARYSYVPSPAQDLPPVSDPFPDADAAKAEFLIVIDMSELKTEKRLKAFTRALPVVAKTERYEVFDLRGGRAIRAARRSRLVGND